LEEELELGYTAESFGGGCISIIIYALLLAYFVSRMAKIYAIKEN
jgi:ABC-type antimicrobial peptide transport system permease subunit